MIVCKIQSIINIEFSENYQHFVFYRLEYEERNRKKQAKEVKYIEDNN